MSTTEKIGKLARAIRRYRGAYHPGSGKWLRAPDRGAGADVLNWLGKLGVSANAIDEIDGFQTHNEFYAWLRKLEKPLPIA